jgi:hypothetical protein
MKKSIIPFSTLLSLLFGLPVHADGLGDVMKGIKLPLGLPGGAGTATNIDDLTAVSGIKEALAIGTAYAVSTVSGVGGYFTNQAIKILQAAEIPGKIGYAKQVDDFVLSMNRAAEAAAPKAKAYFIDAIKAMTLDDARKIVSGGNIVLQVQDMG